MTGSTQRIDTLLALALLFADGQAGSAMDETTISGDRVRVVAEELLDDSPLAALDPDDRELAKRRATWCAGVTEDVRSRWLRHTLRRARAATRGTLGSPNLDEHVHPSHVVEVLRGEPPRTRALILNYLPQVLNSQTVAALDIKLRHGDRRASTMRRTRAIKLPLAANRRRTPDRRTRSERRRAAIFTASSASSLNHSSDADSLVTAHDAIGDEIIAAVRRTFLSRFVSFGNITNPSTVDSLSGAILSALAYALGIRETALACRGITSVEALASFLRRFEVAEAQAIAKQIKILGEVSAARVAHAQRIVQEALAAEPGMSAALDRVGFGVFAIWVSEQDTPNAYYALQKLPLELARELRRQAEEWRASADSGLRRLIADEVESLAGNADRSNVDRAPRTSHGS